MDQWINNWSSYHNILLEREGHLPFTRCTMCAQRHAQLKCSDCFGANIFCKDCCFQVHKRSPFHRIFFWNGKNFVSKSLYSLGFVMCLGHSGDACPKTVEVCFPEYVFLRWH